MEPDFIFFLFLQNLVRSFRPRSFLANHMALMDHDAKNMHSSEVTANDSNAHVFLKAWQHTGNFLATSALRSPVNDKFQTERD